MSTRCARRATRKTRCAPRTSKNCCRSRRSSRKRNPEGKLIDFLTEVALVAAADEIDDSSGTVIAHDPAHREGPRVRHGVRHRRRGGSAAAPHLRERAGRSRRGASAVLRRHHAREEAAVPLARDDPVVSSATRASRCRAGSCRRSRSSSSTGGSRPATRTRAAARARGRSTPGAATARGAARSSATRRLAARAAAREARVDEPRSPARCATTAT